MGIFSKKRLPRSEAAMVVASDLGPISLQLNNHRLTFDDCEWTPEFDTQEVTTGEEGCLGQEVAQLRKDKRRMKKDLDKFAMQAQEMKELKERWNLLDFKYQLLLDMWTMRTLDNKQDED
ncbi:hypothetical protein CY35_02G186900, partial [Sphagnum magellanicum]